MNAYLVTALAYLVYLVVVWFAGIALHLQGRDLWMLRGALAVIGLIASIVFVWFYFKASKQRRAASVASDSSVSRTNEIQLVMRRAEARLRSSKLGRGASLRKLPVVLIIGDSQTAKTSTLVHSGLDAELLEGQVYEESAIVPTRVANLWYAKNTVFLEPSSKSALPGGWSKILRQLQPGRLRSLIGSRAPRAAIVCLPCDLFFQPGATDATSAIVRRTRACLEEVSRTLGISLPVYVIFTKADRIPFFAEFTRNLTNEESAQVMGATFPLRSSEDAGIYAEQETRRLNIAFGNLVMSLAAKRPDLIAREHDSEKLGGAYEFPRELRKLRSPIVQLLVELFKPSQLKATPFLRGVYFSGVRAVVVNEVARPAIAAQPARSGSASQTDATGIFKVGQASASPVSIPQPQVVTARKVPQWTFLTHFFNDVLLQDHVAMAATAASTKTNTLRRALLLTGIVVCVVLWVALLISYSGNKALESEVTTAARAMTAAAIPSSGVPPITVLQQLEILRQSVEKLSMYARNGAPWHLRWGLYVGDGLYLDARVLYFKHFQQLLFRSTQAALIDFLKRLPSTPGPSDDYGSGYETLKAYLITTPNHDKSTQLFLSPVLLKRWVEGRSADADTVALVQKQFDFYSEELKASNPFSSENDTLAVERARRYLSQFAGTERVYQFMLAEASRKSASIAFNKQFPGSAEVLVDTKEVAGAYTKSGWAFMQDAIKNADRYFSGEQWVLGEQSATRFDRAKVEQELRDRYAADFVGQWQQFLRAGSVVRYNNPKDAAAKLNKLSSNQSPLLAMLCVVSQNTAIESPQIKSAFQPVQFVVPATCAEKYVSEPNTAYMSSLVALNGVIEQMANSPGGAGPLTAQAGASAAQAKIVTRQLAQNFRIDPQTHVDDTVQKLLEAPITNAEAFVRNVGPAELSEKGKGLCAQLGDLTSKFPFNPKAEREATLQELNGIFQPQQGALWMFYDASLKTLLDRQGVQFVPKADAPIAVTPAFLNFINSAAAFTDAIYPNNSTQPHLTYSVRPYRVEGVENVTLTIDGQQVAQTGGGGSPKEFVWTGNPNSEVKLTAGGLAYTGVWAPFKFFVDAEKWSKSGTSYTGEWTLRLPRATPLTFRFDVDMGKGAPVFQRAFLANLKCVSEVAR